MCAPDIWAVQQFKKVKGLAERQALSTMLNVPKPLARERTLEDAVEPAATHEVTWSVRRLHDLGAIALRRSRCLPRKETDT